MKPVMYIFVNSQVGMSPGKLAAQAAHAAVEAYRISRNDRLEAWMLGKHYTKYVMDGGDGEKLRTIEHYLKARDFDCELIIDEGRTEIEPFTVTALGVEVVDKDDPHTAATFGEFKTLRPPRREKPLDPNVPWYKRVYTIRRTR